MFRQTYKATIRNLFRSGLFWIILLVLFGIAGYESLSSTSGYTIHDGHGGVKLIRDTSPEYVLGYSDYIQLFVNSIRSNVMFFAMPIVAVVSTVTILIHDHEDKFFEIEKSSGVTPFVYVIGRLSALFTINILVTTLICFFTFHFSVFSRGGPNFMGMGYYIIDSCVRLLRPIVFIALPTVFFYIGITYCLGSIFKSGILASFFSIGYIIFYCLVSYTNNMLLPQEYFEIFSPTPSGISYYLLCYDTAFFKTITAMHGVDFNDAAFSVVFLVSITILTIFISYFSHRKRTV